MKFIVSKDKIYKNKVKFTRDFKQKIRHIFERKNYEQNI